MHLRPVFRIAVLFTLLALACQAAPQSTPAPPTAAPEATAGAASPESTAVAGGAPIAGIESPTTGKYVEKAGLRIFLPEGSEFGGPTIPLDPRPPRYGGTMIRMTTDITNLDPISSQSTQMLFPTGPIYERLVHTPVQAGTDPFVIANIPGLAESWEVSDDFLTYTFHLRRGVKWHNLPPVNGRELDAEDVKFTWELFASPGSVQKGFFLDMDRAEVVDRYTIAMHMKRINFLVLDNAQTAGQGYILPRESVTIDRKLTGIGTGAFMVEKPYEVKVGVSYRRNPDYWLTDEAGNRLPYLDAYRGVLIFDPASAKAAFRTGKVDNGPGLGNPSAVRDFVKTRPTTLIQEYDSLRPGGHGIGFRLDKAPWNDVRVRRAMSMALDYEALAQTVYGVPYRGSVAVIGVWYGREDTVKTVTEDCGCPWFSYDPQRAKALLAEAGYPNGFTTSLEFFQYTLDFAETHELAAAYLSDIGVTVALRSVAVTVSRPNMEKGAWDDLAYIFFVPSPKSAYQTLEYYVPGQPLNANAGWVNDPKMTAWIQEFNASYKEPEKQRALYQQIRARYLDQVYAIPYPVGRTYSAFSPRLRNFQPATSLLFTSDYRNQAYTWIDDDWSFAK